MLSIIFLTILRSLGGEGYFMCVQYLSESVLAHKQSGA